MKLYGATIDLHSTNNVTVVINEHDQVIYQKRLPNDLSPDRAATLEQPQIAGGGGRGGIYL
jgi:hypothetical protein